MDAVAREYRERCVAGMQPAGSGIRGLSSLIGELHLFEAWGSAQHQAHPPRLSKLQHELGECPKHCQHFPGKALLARGRSGRILEAILFPITAYSGWCRDWICISVTQKEVPL